jgi:RNA polymerase sigma factor (sigma-70 family)
MPKTDTPTPTDQELLIRFVRENCQAAFRGLVDRHVNLVYGAAFRGLNQPEAAAEVTQNVFILMARKSHWLCGKSTLAPWLHHAALLEVRQWWRGEYRRQRREIAARELGTLMKDNESLSQALAGALDEGLEGLRPPERAALLLRYFEGLSHREIGLRLGTTEDAARMRVNNALDHLTEFFRGRGYSVPAATATAAVLTATAATATPPGLGMITANAAFHALGTGPFYFLKPWLARLGGLSKTQTGMLCVGLAITPLAWEWQAQRMARHAFLQQQAQLASVREQQDTTAAEGSRLQGESDRLDAELAQAQADALRYAAATDKLASFKSRVQGLLTDGNYRWPEDLPYVRVAKSEIASLDLLHKQGTFDPAGKLNLSAQELLAITSAEKGPAEQALADYQHGIRDLTDQADAYQTNIVTDASGWITDTVAVPPLGEPAKTLGADTADHLAAVLGREREQLLFGDWAQGAIQVFWPGNLWQIADRAQLFTVYVRPDAATGTVAYSSGWHLSDGTGIGPGTGPDPFNLIPAPMFQKFFAPWLARYQSTQPVFHPGEGGGLHE